MSFGELLNSDLRERGQLYGTPSPFILVNSASPALG